MQAVEKYMPMGLLCAFVLKVVLFGTSLSEMGVIFALASLCGIKEYMEKNRRIQTVEAVLKEHKEFLDKKTEEQSNVISKQNEVIKNMADELDRVRSNITGLKMTAGFKKAGGM